MQHLHGLQWLPSTNQKDDIEPTMVEAEMKLCSQYLCYGLSVHRYTYITNIVLKALNSMQKCVLMYILQRINATTNCTVQGVLWVLSQVLH